MAGFGAGEWCRRTSTAAGWGSGGFGVAVDSASTESSAAACSSVEFVRLSLTKSTLEVRGGPNPSPECPPFKTLRTPAEPPRTAPRRSYEAGPSGYVDRAVTRRQHAGVEVREGAQRGEAAVGDGPSAASAAAAWTPAAIPSGPSSDDAT